MYALTSLALGCASVIPISDEEYAQLAEAKAELLRGLFLEEKFDLVIEDFLEFESELLSSTARYMLYGETDYSWFQVERNLLNRRLVNLLSVCRAYIDFARPYLKHASTHAQMAEAAADEFATYYDANIGYRVMEAMRNYVQHRGFPVHALEYGATLDESQSRNRFAFDVAIFTKTKYLRADDTFKASVLAELESLGGRVDLKPLVRDYVSGLAMIHEKVRIAHQGQITRAESVFDVLEQRFTAAFPSEPAKLGLAAVNIDGDERTNEIHLYPGFIERRRQLEAKNRGFGNLGKRYVTGRVRGS